MTTLRDWFYHNRKDTNITKAASDIGKTPSHLIHVVNGRRRASVKLAKELERYTRGEIPWTEIMAYPDAPNAS